MFFSFRRTSRGSERNGAACSCCFARSQPCSRAGSYFGRWRHGTWLGTRGVAALNDRKQPREALRIKAQREYFALGKDFLERGIKNNPDRLNSTEARRFTKEKYKHHGTRWPNISQSCSVSDAPSYDKRFSAYELSHLRPRARGVSALASTLHHGRASGSRQLILTAEISRTSSKFRRNDEFVTQER